MALNFQPYRKEPGGASFGNTIDSIFDTYFRAKQMAGQEADRRSGALLEYGFDPRQVTPDGLQRAQSPMPQGPTLPGQASPEPPLIGALRQFIEKKKSAAAQSSQAQQLGMAKTASHRENAHADRLRREAPVSPGGLKPGERPASTEFTARGFADKASQANQALEATLAGGFDPSSPMNRINSVLPNEWTSAGYQQADQALRQFVNSILRRESGAAIPDSELENYRRQYYAMPGDGPDVQAQKAKARKLAIANLETEASRVPSALTAALSTNTATAPAQAGTPQVGEVRRGYKFKGGNPADKNSWVAVR